MQIIFILILAGAFIAMKNKYSFIPYANIIVSESSKYMIPAPLALAQVSIESNFNPNAVSSSGARGLMQIKADALQDVNLALETQYTFDQLFDPAINVKVGMKYLDMKRDQFHSLYLGYIAYYAGHAPDIAGKMYADSIYALSQEF